MKTLVLSAAMIGSLWSNIACAQQATQPQQQDAPFGCKVALCAPSDWKSIAYCVPVMNQLFQMLKKGGSWPICPEAPSTPPKNEPYLSCPGGSPATVAGGKIVFSSFGDQCASPVLTNAPPTDDAEDYKVISRPLNPQPWSVDFYIPGQPPLTFRWGSADERSAGFSSQ